MSIKQTVTIPADYRISLEVPRSVPIGVKARVKINITANSIKSTDDSTFQTPFEIDEIRQLLQKEMADKSTLAITAASGDGWEAYVRERYAEP